MSHVDPGEQDTRRRRKTRETPAAQVDAFTTVASEYRAWCTQCPAMFNDAQTADAHRSTTSHRNTFDRNNAFTAAKSVDKVMAQHESGHEDRLAFIREKLRELYRARVNAAPDAVRRAMVYVTADDASNILRDAANLGYTDDDEARPWFGAIFREPGWRWIEPKLVPSLNPKSNGRGLRTWAWVDPAPTPAKPKTPRVDGEIGGRTRR